MISSVFEASQSCLNISQHSCGAPSERKPERCPTMLGHYRSDSEREGKGRKQARRKQNEESDERMISNFWRKKKKTCAVLGIGFLVVLLLWGPSWGRRGRFVGRAIMVGSAGGQRSSLCLCACACVCACQPAISCCPATAPALGAWRPSGASCCPGTPAGRRPAPTPGSRRPPSPSDLRTHPQHTPSHTRTRRHVKLLAGLRVRVRGRSSAY